MPNTSDTIIAISTLVASLTAAFVAYRASRRLDKVEPAVASIAAIAPVLVALSPALSDVAKTLDVVHTNTNSLVEKLVTQAAEEAREDALSGNGGAGKKGHSKTKTKRRLK